MKPRARDRKNRIRSFKKNFSTDALTILNWELFEIHQVADNINYDDEFDYWGCDGKDVCLIRICKSRQASITLQRKKITDYLFILIKEDFEKIDRIFLEKCINQLNNLGLPINDKSFYKKYK